jgi:hypothetical protein
MKKSFTGRLSANIGPKFTIYLGFKDLWPHSAYYCADLAIGVLFMLTS